jgi:hypothetical protein
MNFLRIVIYAFSAIKIMGTEHIALSKMNELLDFFFWINFWSWTDLVVLDEFPSNSDLCI